MVNIAEQCLGYPIDAPDAGGQHTQPIEIFSDELHYFPRKEIAIFQGEVKAYQGDMELDSDQMTVLVQGAQQPSHGGDLPKDSKIKKVDLEGNVHIITPEEQAISKRGEYDVDTGIATLYEDVKLMQGENWMIGDKFIHNRNTGESLMYGDALKNKRVRGYFVPDTQKEKKHG